MPVDRCLPAPGIAQSLQCGGRRGATRKRFVTSQVLLKGLTVIVLVRYTYRPAYIVHLQSFDPWLRQVSSWTSPPLDLWKLALGLLRCLLVLRHLASSCESSVKSSVLVPWSWLVLASVIIRQTCPHWVVLTADRGPCSLLCQHVQLESLITN